MNTREIIMKQILLGLLFLASTSIVSAQIASPTINYQGRAQDADGNAVTGERQIILTIYDAATGGTALFSETHPTVLFSNAGAFTVVIGGATPGGIPSTIEFDKPRWIGVTISGFNNGNELPRLRFHGSPYSFVSNFAFDADSSRTANSADRANAAAFADSSVAADRARTALEAETAITAETATTATTATTAELLVLPATLENNDKTATLTLKNTDTGPALQVEGGLVTQGERYAITSEGIDSTTKHYTTAELAGNTTAPDPGGLYRDNVPLAWGQIDLDGTILSDFGINRVAHNSNNPGLYEIYLDNSVVTNADSQIPEFAVVITPYIEAGSVSAPLVIPGWDYLVDPTDKQPLDDAFQVYLRTNEFGQDQKFSVVVFGRPAK